MIRLGETDSITVVISFVALAVYAGLYKYLENADNKVVKNCVLTTRNANLQNKLDGQRDAVRLLS